MVDIGFIVVVLFLMIGSGMVKWKNMKNNSSKAMFFTVAGVIAVLIVVCINRKNYSIMNLPFMRGMVMSMYHLMKG
ncbi:hypothetical protein [Paenibacillus glycanilyticus]|uniref:Uncharacterized protein n=1 Tax=Paenibacillus glycanilyticus TaxID=126569 RepID=A0ABQ6GD49_9BACL|nr:hypothetical protein [Paenibacillus glycanilyticus]GLX68869.1 hypothetical protein MU1_32140 [Paenibacillus glycanilyticus]